MRYVPGNFKSEFQGPLGQHLWSYLTEPDTLIRLETASELGKPALQPLGWRLLESFGEDVRADRVKQMIGHMTRQIMESRGFQLVKSGQSIRNNSLFSSAALYAPELLRS